MQPSISSIYLPDLPPSSLSNRSQSCTGCTQGRGKYLDSSHTWSQFPRLAASPGLRGSSGQSRVLSAAETFWASLNLHRVSLGPAPGPYCASAGAGGWPCQLVVPRWCPGGRGGPRAGRPVSSPGSSLSLCSSPLSRTARQNPSHMLCEVDTIGGGAFIRLEFDCSEISLSLDTKVAGSGLKGAQVAPSSCGLLPIRGK